MTLTYDQAVATYKAQKEKLDKRLHSIQANIKAFTHHEKKRYESKNRQDEQVLLDQLENDLDN